MDILTHERGYAFAVARTLMNTPRNGRSARSNEPANARRLGLRDGQSDKSMGGRMLDDCWRRSGEERLINGLNWPDVQLSSYTRPLCNC
ncbi:uncharacterized protein LOC112588779 isoform X2 [Harpegnathos saltator]|uniref:uncharacterized protein LOC112588779 isoform X2 n=1 Tax=Harpegnathos saltator TaxID=610380 RepID=UPI000DBED48D|nr:uncharacterized protein LOC112588779 isoform X2 [Harpegnathos saltator]